MRELCVTHKPLYIMLIGKIKRSCHFFAPNRNGYNVGKLILLFLWSSTWLILGEPCSIWQSCSSSWELGSDSSTLSVNTLCFALVIAQHISQSTTQTKNSSVRCGIHTSQTVFGCWKKIYSKMIFRMLQRE